MILHIEPTTADKKLDKINYISNYMNSISEIQALLQSIILCFKLRKLGKSMRTMYEVGHIFV